jgi:hypothetical protein
MHNEFMAYNGIRSLKSNTQAVLMVSKKTTIWDRPRSGDLAGEDEKIRNPDRGASPLKNTQSPLRASIRQRARISIHPAINKVLCFGKKNYTGHDRKKHQTPLSGSDLAQKQQKDPKSYFDYTIIPAKLGEPDKVLESETSIPQD